jgi:hypothetical protein
MAELKSISDLEAATNQSRVDFLQTDLALCFTFADLAKTEYQSGDRDAARSILEKAEIGYATDLPPFSLPIETRIPLG